MGKPDPTIVLPANTTTKHPGIDILEKIIVSPSPVDLRSFATGIVQWVGNGNKGKTTGHIAKRVVAQFDVSNNVAGIRGSQKRGAIRRNVNLSTLIDVTSDLYIAT